MIAFFQDLPGFMLDRPILLILGAGLMLTAIGAARIGYARSGK